jgi:zinc transport system substrate-binding protein
MAEQIGGEYVDVVTVTPAGEEPHDYEPTARQIATIQESDILILNGGGFEAWGERIQTSLKSSPVRIVITGQNLISQNDPHVFLDPKKAKEQATIIFQTIVNTDPAHRQYYTNRANALFKKFDELDTQYRTGLARCETKEFITTHAAFSYLAKEYELTQIAISGLSPEAEPSIHKITEITAYAKDHHIDTIFFERLASPKIAQAIAQEVGAKTQVLDPLEGLTETEIKSGINYFIIMQNNLTNLRLALKCQ